MTALVPILVQLILAALHAAPTDDLGWPSKLDWTSVTLPSHEVRQRDPVKAELQNPRSTGALRVDEMNVKLDLGPYALPGTRSRNSGPGADDPAFPDVQSFRVASFSLKSNRFTSVPEVPIDVRPLYGKRNQVALALPRSLVVRPSDERLAIFAHVTRDGVDYWLAFARSYQPPPKVGPSLALSYLTPGFSPSQLLLDGRQALVLRNTVEAKVSDLLPNRSGTWVDLGARGTFSTERLDPVATGYLQVEIGRKFGFHDLSRLLMHFGFKGNQSGRSLGPFARLLLHEIIPAKTLHRRSTILETDDYACFSLGFVAEQRWERQDDASPHHISPTVGYASGRLEAGPIWLFPKVVGRGSFATDLGLLADLQGYYFPNEHSRAGFSAGRLESYAGLTLSLPLKLVFFAPALYLRTGAIEGQQFFRSVQWGLELSAKF